MKRLIQLTKTQIDELVKKEIEELRAHTDKTIKLIEEKFNKDVEKVRAKFEKPVFINIPDEDDVKPTKTSSNRISFTDEDVKTIIKLYMDGKKAKEICNVLSKNKGIEVKQVQVNAKIANLKVKGIIK